MTALAEWSDSTGVLHIVGPGEEILYEGHASEMPTAVELVKEQGYKFLDLWRKDYDLWIWIAAIEKEEGGK